ncbi:LON peptidase substrate-binding domain-containing protein [Curvivirga aplysinae]|uniref:LON peptidase substrate-binding domain-containing protein n=1 Tax=Curvivirga aplysinae TaxID=2529852 RepID=UPI001C3F6F58|nr:LON peptidase substrate-binding domain-containing protein [Curvivirga aplysinae]
MGRFDPAFDDLPTKLAIFPLPNVLMLPGQILPLNIFEDRYINMFEDVLSKGRLMGMIQPRDPDETEMRTQIVSGIAPLFNVGCMGRVTNFEETSDGRFTIQLRGVCRFTLMEEAVSDRGYREAIVGWSGFEEDLKDSQPITVDKRHLMPLLERYLTLNNMNVDLRLLENTQVEILIDALAMICPFGPVEKQALLEAGTLQERAAMLITLLEMAVLQNDESGGFHTN